MVNSHCLSSSERFASYLCYCQNGLQLSILDAPHLDHTRRDGGVSQSGVELDLIGRDDDRINSTTRARELC